MTKLQYIRAGIVEYLLRITKDRPVILYDQSATRPIFGWEDQIEYLPDAIIATSEIEYDLYKLCELHNRNGKLIFVGFSLLWGTTMDIDASKLGVEVLEEFKMQI
jgi:hypothetical protein